MAGRDPNIPQLDFPQLVADLIADLRLTGQVGLLDFSDLVRPVFIIGSRGGSLQVTAAPPVFSSASVAGATQINPVANTLIAGTGPLPAGDYDVFCSISFNGVMNVTGAVVLQHRDAADAATLEQLLQLGMTTTQHAQTILLPTIGYTLALNESLRVIVILGNVTGTVSSAIGSLLRPTP